MCGIVGFIGDENVEKNLINLLKKLEYRGYDSAGIGLIDNNEIVIKKSKGKIYNLESKITEIRGVTTGIGHTRWATHGEATENNAHPHLSNSGNWAIVHNGIIENFEPLKNSLIKMGTTFYSDTDSEVVSNLLDNTIKSGINALIDVCSKLIGSYSIACINRFENNKIYLAKNKSPLYICVTKNIKIVASDPICFEGYSDSYYSLEDYEFATLSNENVHFFDKNGKKILKNQNKIKYSNNNNNEKIYPYQMIKEIYESKNLLFELVKKYKEVDKFIKLKKAYLLKINRIRLVGCGTAYHSALIGAKYLNKYTKIESTAHIASEFKYDSYDIDSRTLVIFVSQSGETADTISALEKVKKKGAFTIAVTNAYYSTLSKKADMVLEIYAGPEIAVASTKAYVCQIGTIYALARYIKSRLKNTKYNIKNLQIAAKNIKFIAENEIIDLIKYVKTKDNIFFLGRGVDYITAMEGALKLKEISYINANAYPAGELKHGVLALVEEDTPVVLIATNKKLLFKSLNSSYEAIARGAKVILITPFDEFVKKTAGIIKVIKIPNINDDMIPILAVIPLQLIAYYVCVSKELNPDMPRNLAKSVTVE